MGKTFIGDFNFWTKQTVEFQTSDSDFYLTKNGPYTNQYSCEHGSIWGNSSFGIHVNTNLVYQYRTSLWLGEQSFEICFGFELVPRFAKIWLAPMHGLACPSNETPIGLQSKTLARCRGANKYELKFFSFSKKIGVFKNDILSTTGSLLVIFT